MEHDIAHAEELSAMQSRAARDDQLLATQLRDAFSPLTAGPATWPICGNRKE